MRKVSTGISLAGLKVHIVPFVVWIGTIVCIVALFSHRSQRFQVLGIAQGQVRLIATTSTARLVSVPVQLFEKVKAGDTVAIVDTVLDNEQALRAELNAQLAAAGVEREKLKAALVFENASLLSERADRQGTRLEEYRRFSSDVESVRLRILEIEAEIATDQIAHDDLATQIKIAEQLIADGNDSTVEIFALRGLKTQRGNLTRKMGEYRQMLQQAGADLVKAEQRHSEYAQSEVGDGSITDALNAIRTQIDAHEELKAQIRGQIEALNVRQTVELKAPFDGVVIPIPLQAGESAALRSGEKLLRRPGEVVSAGEPILAIAEADPREIIAYVSEGALGHVRENMEVQMVKSRERAQIARSVVLSIGPTAERMPERLWYSPNIPQWGWPVLLNVPPGMELVAGEVVRIKDL